MGWSIDNGMAALAQLETGGGAKTIKGPNGEDSNNLFNIKDFSGGGFRAHDKAEGSRDAYRAYGSHDESRADLQSLLARKYPNALTAQNAEQFFGALKQGGYATDPLYVSKGVSVANRLGGSMPQAQTAPAQAPAPNLQAFADAGWGDEIKFAKSKGIDDATIFSKLSDQQTQLRAQQTAQQNAQGTVATMGAQGADPFTQLTALRQAGYDKEIEFARSHGFTPEQIVAKLAPLAVQQGKAAHDQVASDGMLVTGAKAAGDTVTGLVRGTRQAFNQATGDDATFKTLQGDEAASRGDLNRVARESTVAGKVGAAAPYLAAAAIPGVNTIAGGAAVGAGLGLAQPTVDGESRLSNAAMGAVGGGGPVAAFKGLGMAGRVAARAGQSSEQAANIAALQAEGIAVPRHMQSGAGSVANEFLGKIPGAKWGVADGEGALQSSTQQAITKRMGIEGTNLSSDAINAAEQANNARYTAALGDTTITVPEALRSSLTSGMKSQINSADPMVRAEMARTLIPEIASLEQNGTISAQALNKLRSQLGSDGSGASLTAAQKQAYGSTRQAVTDALEQGLPAEQLTALQEANSFHKNIMVGRDMVAKMKDDPNSDVIKALTQAVSSAKNRGDFVHGNAPMQDLQSALAGLSRNKGTLADVVGGSTSSLLAPLAALHSGGLSLLAGIPANIAMRILNSAAPEVRAAVSKLTPVAQAGLAKKAAQVNLGVTEEVAPVAKAVVPEAVPPAAPVPEAPVAAPVAPAAVTATAPVSVRQSIEAAAKIQQVRDRVAAQKAAYAARPPSEVEITAQANGRSVNDELNAQRAERLAAKAGKAPEAVSTEAPVSVRDSIDAAAKKMENTHQANGMTVYADAAKAGRETNFDQWFKKYSGDGGNDSELFLHPGAFEAAGAKKDAWVKRATADHLKFMRKQ